MSKRQHIIVVGSGIAGLIAALELSHNHAITLVTKSELAESNTRWAQGGIAAAMFPDDSVAEHVADTLRAGAGLCDTTAVEVLCSEGPARIRDLIRLGVSFDKRNGELARGLEAAHSHARILHAGGDATGLSVELALVHAVRDANIEVLDHTFACDLILDENEKVNGLEIIDSSNTRRTIPADAVILASGGAGQLYLHTTNPTVATGDGVAMALRAGAEVADLEFYQFHPTALATPDTFLVSEAVRGDGAVLLDAHGRRFMQLVHPDAELAPRDVVARGIARQMAMQGGKPVLLDATGLVAARGADFLATRFPTIDAAVRSRGFDWATQPIPVTPAAHYWMGGVRTDIWGCTSVAGLYAVGEVACTGVHGANRLASNSLLESLVFAWRCAAFINEGRQHSGLLQQDREPTILQLDQPSTIATTPLDRTTLQTLMWNAAGIERNGKSLEAAAAQLRGFHTTGETIAELETANLLALARVLVTAALARQESRGAHFRDDYPETSDEFQHSLLYLNSAATLSNSEVSC
jgi:L-aspartate oxidase